MSIDNALQRVSTITQALSNPSSLVGSNTALTGGVAAPSDGTGSAAGAASTSAPSAFAAVLANASSQLSTPGLGSSVPVPGNQIVAVAASQIGQAEQPPGSNDSPAIAQYRTATAGAAPGEPWCAYFASWAARQAGEPIGDQGQGLGSVSAIWSWAQSAGRAVQNGPGVTPKPGDLIVFGAQHVGIVAGVLPDGRIQTIEGNYNNQVSQNTRSPTEATGYVSMS
jgi:CHAP domain